MCVIFQRDGGREREKEKKDIWKDSYKTDLSYDNMLFFHFVIYLTISEEK